MCPLSRLALLNEKEQRLWLLARELKARIDEALAQKSS
jgi:hypothetical protein